jgi:hypothetical protein
MELDVNGSQIADAISGVPGMQPPQIAGLQAGQQQQQQQSQEQSHQQQQQQQQQQPQNHAQQPSHIDPGSAESYQADIEEKPRGRERSRDGPAGDMVDGSETSGSGRLGDGTEVPTTRKRRRSRKGLDKKFECPHPGCGKSYSRAEHLYRHQLNRKPSLILLLGIGTTQT